MELMYHRKGDYLFPNLVIEEQPKIVILYILLLFCKMETC